MVTKEDVIESIGNMSVVDFAELTQALIHKFNLTIAAPRVEAPPVTVNVPEQEEFEIVLVSITDPMKKIPVLKVVRNVTGLSLKDSKELVDSIPKTVKNLLSKHEAEVMKTLLEAAGAVVELK